MVSTRAEAPGLLVPGFGSLPAERSRRRHVWLLGGGEAGEDGVGWSQEAGSTPRVRPREGQGAPVLGMRGKPPQVCFPAEHGGGEWDAGVFAVFAPSAFQSRFISRHIFRCHLARVHYLSNA